MSVKWRLCCCLGVWVCLLYNFPLTEGQYSVIGSPQPIVAIAGDDVILPCHVEPALSVADMTIEWSRPDLTPRHVHLHQDGRSSSDGENPSYRYRTTLFTGELKNANVSLKLFRVKLSDEGMYRCFIPSLGSQVKETQIQLIVGAVSDPKLLTVDLENERVVLQCESGGWHPEPEVEWLDSEGHVLSAGPTETLKDPDGTYNVRRLVTVEKTATNRFTCRVQQQHINHTSETEINVPGTFFINTPSTPYTGAIGVGIALVLTLSAAGGVFIIIWRRKKNKKKTNESGRTVNDLVVNLKTEKDKENNRETSEEDKCSEETALKPEEEIHLKLNEAEQKLQKLQEEQKETGERNIYYLKNVKEQLELIQTKQIETETKIKERLLVLKTGILCKNPLQGFKTSDVSNLERDLTEKLSVLEDETKKLRPNISAIERLLPFMFNMESKASQSEGTEA